MKLTLRRILSANNATLGILSGLPKPLYVLEDSWRNNQRSVSCIPAGTYRVTPHGWDTGSPVKYKQTWRLLNVPNRTGILIHAGNTHKDTEGCLLVGMGMQVSQLASLVTDSRIAIDFMRKEIGEGSFILEIVDAAGVS
jgi:hypothetical protein